MYKTTISQDLREINKNSRFKDLCLIWLQKKKIKLKQSSYNKYDYLIRDYILPELGELFLAEIDLLVIEQGIVNIYISNKEKVISNSLMKSILYVVNAILTYGTRLDYFLVGKAIFELPPIHDNNKIITLSPYEESNLISYLLKNKTHNNLGIMISLFTGIRLGEVCALQRKDIDLNRTIIYVRSTAQRMKLSNSDAKTKLVVTTPKSKKSYREIPIPTFLNNYINEYELTELNDDWYILSRSNIPYEPRTLQYGFKNAMKKCEIENKSYHCLRHTFATNCIKSGFDIKTLSEILGHTSVNFTLNRYVHSDIEQKRNQMEKLVINYKFS